MKTLYTTLLLLCLLFTGMELNAQTTYDEMEFEPDSSARVYKPGGKSYVFIRSKRGTSGVTRTGRADSLLSLSLPVNEIVLVFTELDPGSIEYREDANRERWENLLMTYPQFFQFSTIYKNYCQCNDNGDSAAFKKAQGFYIFYEGNLPTPAASAPARTEAKTEAPSPPVTKTEKPKAEETPVPARTEEKKTDARKAEEIKTHEKPAVADNTSVAAKEPEPKTAEQPKKEPEPAAAKEETDDSEGPPAKTTRSSASKRPAPIKPRRAKDPKACRPPCYGWGDEDLIGFFKDNIQLTKKEKKKAKKWIAQVRIQLNVDGSVKKAMVTGDNENFNQKVNDAIKLMNNWNAAVKSGVTVKSEVRFTLKFDKPSKTFRPYDIIGNPKPSAKCPCVPDTEMFGS
jgi:hypothetical protein